MKLGVPSKLRIHYCGCPQPSYQVCRAITGLLRWLMAPWPDHPLWNCHEAYFGLQCILIWYFQQITEIKHTINTLYADDTMAGKTHQIVVRIYLLTLSLGLVTDHISSMIFKPIRFRIFWLWLVLYTLGWLVFPVCSWCQAYNFILPYHIWHSKGISLLMLDLHSQTIAIL